jgi:vacuolar-type H+-ATPase subunit I/STV1
MKRHYNSILIGILLILLSVFFYSIQYIIFRDLHGLFFYLLEDTGFVFIEVLLVTLIIHQMLNNREKSSMLKKLNMVIGAFFSEVGISLIENFQKFNNEKEMLCQKLLVDNSWPLKKFAETRKVISDFDYKIDVHKGDLENLKVFLVSKRSFFLGLLENPNLLEHQNFTELLWAVFHLTEELSHRKTVDGLPQSDYQHLSGDIKRAYSLLVLEWLSYMQHLKDSYPYLFSLAVRTNPFNPDASVEVLETR